MRLHRLVLTNYRGIAHREIDFPDHGVIVICGANEVGKTSMIEALDLLLESRDRSTKKEVKQVKPTHADVGSEVLAEISTGPYRFVYRKRFHKKCETELTITAPRREQLTGDEAHERVQAMLAETVDTGLWHAQRVLQAASTAAVDLSGCDALSRALDVAAGDAAALSGTEPLLIERIDTEYGRYFTATGRPTGAWSEAIAQIRRTDEEVARCAAAVAEVDERVRAHAGLTERLTGLAGRRPALSERAGAAEAAAAALAELTRQLESATLMATTARATGAASAAANAERVRLAADVDSRSAAAADLQAALAAAVEDEATAHEVAEIASAAAEEATAGLTAAQSRMEQSRDLVDALAAREEAERLTARLSRIDAAQHNLEQVAEQLSGITLTDEVMSDVQSAAALVERCDAQLAQTAATIEFTATTDVELTVDGEVIRLQAGQQWSPPASAPSAVAVPGLLDIRIDPGATTAQVRTKRDEAQQLLHEALAQGGAADVAEANLIDQRRRALVSTRDQAAATLLGVRGDDHVDQLRARLAALPAGTAQPDQGDGPDAARAELTAASEAFAQAMSAAETHRRVAAGATAQLAQKTTQTTVLRDRLAATGVELEAARQRLVALRESAADDEVASRAAADAQAHEQAEALVAELAGRCSAANPEAVAAELESARAGAAALEREHAEVERALHDIAVELAVMGTEGRHGNLDAAKTAREHAAAEHARVSRRARSASLLRSVMGRHRDTTRQRYVEPFRTEVERLGRPVFGPSFEVEVDSDLRICNRTLDGRTVPYESLSGGAKEQLGILARLAGAALVAKEDSVPVVIDDALGFTDPQRLTKMGAVFDNVGNHGQVIVLTCMPTRYLGIADAHVIELTA